MRRRRRSCVASSSSAACRRTGRGGSSRRRWRSTKSVPWPITSLTTTTRWTRRGARWKRCGLESELSEDLGGVLAQPRRRAMLPGLEPPSRGDLRVRRHLVQVEHRLAARVDSRQLQLPLVARARGEDLFHLGLRLELFGVLLVDEVWPVDRLAQR